MRLDPLEIVEALDLDVHPDAVTPAEFCTAADVALVARGWPSLPYEEGSIEDYFLRRFWPINRAQVLVLLRLDLRDRQQIP